MFDVVGALADLSALRNRDQLDIDLVSLVKRVCGQEQCAIRLACVVGEEDNARWLTCCRQDSDALEPVRDTVGVDLSALPVLSSVGYWQDALTSGKINQVGIEGGSGPFAAVFPYGSAAQGTVGVLELLTPRGLPPKTCETIAGILRIYQNLQGLLDYGEKDTLTELLQAPDAPALLHWLHYQKLALLETVGNQKLLMLHAGVLPAWKATKTIALAADQNRHR